jgi:hypothetical protein
MSLELSLALVMPGMAALAALHAFATRPRREAALFVGLAVGFGYLFPLLVVNGLSRYTFHGELTVLHLPVHLGLTWFAFYYLAFCLAEHLLGPTASPRALALVAGLLFGLLEVQWDLTLLRAGTMEFFIPSFFAYPWNFHVGVPMFHALLGFDLIYAFLRLRGSGRPLLAWVLGLLSIVLIPASVMAMVPLMEPVFAAVSPRVGPAAAIALDLAHFSSTFVGVGLVAALWLRFLARRLGQG